MADKTRDGKTALQALSVAIVAMMGQDPETTSLRYDCLIDLRGEAEKMITALRKQAEQEAKAALADAQKATVDAKARLRQLKISKPKRGRPEGAKNKVKAGAAMEVKA